MSLAFKRPETRPDDAKGVIVLVWHLADSNAARKVSIVEIIHFPLPKSDYCSLADGALFSCLNCREIGLWCFWLAEV